MEEKEKKCNCNETCTCEDCTCTEENKCSEECTCGCEKQEETCGKTCNCEEECTCEEDCACKEGKDCECEACSKDKQVEEPKEKKKGLFSKKEKQNEKIEELNQKISTLEDKVLRQSAEFANYKRRREEETSRMMKYSNEDIVKELLPIIDNFERAINMDDDNLEDEVSKFLSGFKMIYCNMNQILEKQGVTEIEALHKEFDPNIHQAVMTESRDGVDAGIVIEVLQKGYRLKDKVIRPAMVKVSE